MFPELCPVCHYMSYKEESGEYYSDGMQISPDEGYCSHCDFRYSQHIKHPMQEQVKKHIRWLKKMSDIYTNIHDEFCGKDYKPYVSHKQEYK